MSDNDPMVEANIREGHSVDYIEFEHLEGDQFPTVPVCADCITTLVTINNDIQEFISVEGDMIPNDLIRMLSNLDWATRNTFGDPSASDTEVRG